MLWEKGWEKQWGPSRGDGETVRVKVQEGLSAEVTFDQRPTGNEG